MTYACCVPGCSISASLPAHRLPKNQKKRDMWLEAICRTDLVGKAYDDVQKCRICFDHFPESMIRWYSKKRMLVDNAVPTLNLPKNNILNSTLKPQMETIIDTDETVQNLTSTNDSFLSVTEQNTVITDINISSANYFQNISTNSNVNNTDAKILSTLNVPEKTSNAIQIALQSLNKNGEKYKLIKAPLVFGAYRVKYLTEREKRIFDKFKKCKRVLYNQKSTIRNLQYQLEKIKVKAKSRNIPDFPNNLSSVQKALVNIICKNGQRKDVGRRYTNSEKCLALTLYKKMGLCAYNSVRNIFPLPSLKGLSSLFHKLPMKCGINPFIIDFIKEQSNSLIDIEKICILAWDEVFLSQYDLSSDQCSNENQGINETDDVTLSVLVFMVRGFHSGWKLPISFNYCDSQTKTAQLVLCIKEHVKTLFNVGLKVIGTVCTDEAFNVNAINTLLTTTNSENSKDEIIRSKSRQTFEVNGMEIIPLFDPPSLMKSIRDNLLTKYLEMDCNLRLEPKLAMWDIVKTAYLIDKHTNTVNRMLRLTDEHIIINKIRRKQIKYVVEVFSRHVAGYIELLSKLEANVNTPVGQLTINQIDGMNTSRALSFFNNLFDSVNSSGFDEKVLLRCPVTDKSSHLEFWKTAKQVLKNMQYIDPNCLTPVTVACLGYWIFTIENVQKIWENVKEHGFSKLKTRNLNLDILRSFQRDIKNYCTQNTDPTPKQFEHAFYILFKDSITAPINSSSTLENNIDMSLLLTLEKYIGNDTSQLKFKYKEDGNIKMQLDKAMDQKSSVFIPEDSTFPAMEVVMEI